MAAAKILIVEDEGIEAMDLQQRLKGLGYAASEIAFTGEEALRMAEELRPDLVLMDIMLPGKMDGVTAAEKLRAGMDIPVVYLTAYADDATLERAKITEPYGYIVKPFKERELHVTIDMALYKHRTERKLKESEKWLSTTLRSIGDAVISTDRFGRISFMNPVAEGLMGWKLEEVRDKKLTEVFKIINKDTRKPVENPVEKVISQGVIVGLANHTMLIARDGTETPIDDSAAPIRDDKGDILGVILVFRDVAEREKAAAELRDSEANLRAALQEKETLLKELYHRTKNNMNVISSLLDLQMRAIKGPEIAQLLKEMQNRIHAMALVHEKLYTSQDLHNLDIRDYVEDLAESIHSGFGSNKENIALKLDIESIPFSLDHAIPCGLIINELMSNALKYAFTNAKSGQIEIALRALQGDEIELVFSDNGRGLPTSLDIRKTKSLGLKVVHNLAEKQLAGKIECISDGGTKYRMRFNRPVDFPGGDEA